MRAAVRCDALWRRCSPARWHWSLRCCWWRSAPAAWRSHPRTVGDLVLGRHDVAQHAELPLRELRRVLRDARADHRRLLRVHIARRLVRLQAGQRLLRAGEARMSLMAWSSWPCGSCRPDRPSRASFLPPCCPLGAGFLALEQLFSSESACAKPSGVAVARRALMRASSVAPAPRTSGIAHLPWRWLACVFSLRSMAASCSAFLRVSAWSASAWYSITDLGGRRYCWKRFASAGMSSLDVLTVVLIAVGKPSAGTASRRSD
jgi:hypothetical protein